MYGPLLVSFVRTPYPPVQPTMDEMTPCFREVDCASLVLGLSAFPWGQLGPVDGIDPAALVQSSLPGLGDALSTDWATLAWLLEELCRKLDHLSTSK